MLVVATALIHLSGCRVVPKQKESPFESSFSTKILSNDAKLFTYSMSLMKPKKIVSRTDYFLYHPSLESVEELLDTKVERMLRFNRYCRSGFVENDRVVLSDYASIKGECNEAANEEDRKRFPNINKPRR